jgi:hypothetical protein
VTTYLLVFVEVVAEGGSRRAGVLIFLVGIAV